MGGGGIPASTRGLVVIAVPIAEALSVITWFTSQATARLRIFSIRAAIGLLLLFTTAYVGHLVFGTAPTCGCMGKLLRFRDSITEAQFVIIRNAILLAVLGAGHWALSSRRHA